MLVSAFGSLAAYLSVFLFIWFRLFQRGAYNKKSLNLRQESQGKTVLDSPLHNEVAANAKQDRRERYDAQGGNPNRELDRAALLMLLFPVT